MKMFMVALLTVISASVVAKPGDTFVKEDSEAVFKLYYTNPSPAKVRVRILDASNEVIFAESINNEKGFVRPYNMKNLPEGTYTFEINNGDDVETYNFTYEMPKSELGVKVREMSDNKFLLSIGNITDVNANVRIVILDGNGEYLYTSTEVVTSQFAQVFNLENVEGGVSFKIYNNNEIIKEASF